jgi:hypothetical protein
MLRVQAGMQSSPGLSWVYWCILSYSGSHRHVGIQRRQATVVLCRCHQKAYGGYITLNSLNKGDLLQAIFSIGGQYHHDAAWISLLTLLDTLY